MSRISFGDRLRYRFDNIMARGAVATITWLLIISILLILFFTILVFFTSIDPEGRGFLEMGWATMMRAIDPGTMAGDTGNWAFLILMLLVTLSGIFTVSILIGILTAGIEDKLTDLRKGRSFVAETGHTVILGWSHHVFTILSELIIAGENQKRTCIVILADVDKIEMDDEISDNVRRGKNTVIVTRSGSPLDRNDLEIVNIEQARSIIILAGADETGDIEVVKSILALTNTAARRTEPYHIVAPIRNRSNLEVARMVGGDEVQLVLAGEVISRIAAQTCRQSGLSAVYTELLDFSGDEIYFQEEPTLFGKTFGEALFAYEDSALMGIRLSDGRILLNPPMDTVLKPGDMVIAISEDDDTVIPSTGADISIDVSAITEGVPETPGPERTLVLGWNRRAPLIVREMDNYVAQGSELMVVAEREGITDREFADRFRDFDLKNTTLSYRRGDTADRTVLESLDVASYDHIVLLSYTDRFPPQTADAQALVTLLHLRDIQERFGIHLSIVSEMQDIKNLELAETAKADDFIVSDNLISLMLSQISENRELKRVFDDLFDPDGSEIYLKPVADYVETAHPVNFYTVLEAARRKNEVAIGYRLADLAFDAEYAYGVFVNPKKTETLTFCADDRIIVLAED
ncbi:MAG: potassium transporter TrkA [Deltaproteobacteria bacterium]|nr:potassium transporter TrkA [Candidatus Zymogenaceae bacterium]